MPPRNGRRFDQGRARLVPLQGAARLLNAQSHQVIVTSSGANALFPAIGTLLSPGQ
jgi:hypothetical protein